MQNPFSRNTTEHLKSAGVGAAFAAATIVAGVVAGQAGQIAAVIGGTVLLNTKLRVSKPLTTVITAVAGGFVLPRLAGIFLAAASPYGANATPQHDAVAMTATQDVSAKAPAPKIG
jgi:hypothetical protein